MFSLYIFNNAMFFIVMCIYKAIILKDKDLYVAYD